MADTKRVIDQIAPELLPDMRSGAARVGDVLGMMGQALDRLEECVTYLDGFRSGCLVASGDVPGMSGIQNLFVDLRSVEDAMERVHSMLEDIAGGEGRG